MEADLTPDVAARADRDLLRAFVDRADAAAFAELVARHGPLVLGACKRVLADAPDAEDAFQATFLILARKAHTVRTPERLGAWLYGVALRCAFRVRKRAGRAKEQPMPELPAPAAPDPEWADVRRVLDAEIGKLPEKLRTVLVLCELQGLDRSAAATRLGVPIGTVSSRLSRAKDSLRRRLVRRGITLSLVALGLSLSRAAEAAAVPPPLASATVAEALRFASRAAGGSPAAVLAGRILYEQFSNKLGAWIIVAGLVLLLLWGGWRLLRPVNDRELIQGTWTFVSFEYEGKAMPKMPGAFRLVIDEERMSGFAGRYKLDPSQTPKAIDMEFEAVQGAPLVLPGVYELTKDRLTIALGPPGGGRPTGVDDPQAVARMVLERVPE